MIPTKTRPKQFLLASGFLFLISCPIFAQVSQAKPSPAPVTPDMSAEKRGADDPQTPLTTFEEEMKAKRLIRLAEKEHEENLSRAREISQLGHELRESIGRTPTLDREGRKKLERIEKLTRKIRGEAGGGDDDTTIEDAPADVRSAVLLIADNAELLSKEVQKTPRQVVSTSVIDRANVLLQLFKMLRGFLR